VRREVFVYELVEWRNVRTGNLNSCIQWIRDGDSGQLDGEIIREDRLKQNGGHTNGLPLSSFVCDAANELKELRRANDRVRN
jgi:hypothetical protein